VPDAPIVTDGTDAPAGLANGTTCTTNGQCANFHCIDGVCCDSACTGQCQSCSATPGTCKSVTTPRSSCGGTGLCAGSCDGTSPACVFPGSSTTCSQASCQNSTTALLPTVCNGSGTCPPAATNPCTYVCTANACGGVCSPGGPNQCSAAGVPQQCNTSGQWQDLTACQTGQACSGAGVCGCPSNACGTTCQVCSPGQRCSAGACVCDATSCPSGCCNGSTCVPVASQTATICGGGASGTCKQCTGQACVNGACAGTCTPNTSCNDLNECTSPDTCNSSGACVGTPKANDSTCTSNLYGSCQSGTCGCYQNAIPVSCTSGPSCLNWGFESGTTEGWEFDPDPSYGAGVTNVTVSSTHVHTGTRSLAVTMDIGSQSSTGAGSVSVVVPVCASTGTVNFAGYTFSAWVYFTVSSGSVPEHAANLVQGITASTDTTVRGQFDGPNPPPTVGQSNLNQWMHVQASVSQVSTANTLAGIFINFALDTSAGDGFSGTMYIDDVQLSPP